MNSTQVREHGGLRFWLLLVTIGVALVAALGMGTTKAWAEEETDGIVSTPDDFAAELKACISGSSDGSSNNIAVTGTGVQLTGNVTLNNGSSYQSGTGKATNCTLSFSEPMTLDLAGHTLTLSGKSFIVLGNATLTIESSGERGILTGGSTNTVIQVGLTDTSGSLVLSSGSVTGNEKPAITVPNGSCVLNGGTITGGKAGTSETGRLSAVAVQNTSKLTVNGATINAPNSALPNNPAGDGGGGIGVFGAATLDVLSGNVSGGRAISTNGSQTSGANINIYGGTLTGASSSSAFYLPSPSKQNQNNVTISGGTISGGVGVANLGSKVTVTVNPGPTITSTATSGESLSIGGDGTTTAFSFPPAGLVNGVASGNSYNANTEATVDGGTISGGQHGQGIVNGTTGTGSESNGAPTLTVTGNAVIDGNVVNNAKGEVAIEGGQINGNLDNTSSTGGKIEWSGGQVTGTVDGVDKVTPPAEPGTAEALQGAVIGVKAPVTAAMAPYATVTVNSAGNVWNIEVVDGAEATPVSTIAQTLVVPIVNAIASASSPSVTSVQNSALTITLPNTTDNVLAFSQGVLEAAVVNTDANLATPATLGELEGLTCGINAATNTGSVTYTFNFAGEAPEPPAADYEAVYRLYNPYDFLHIYTRDANEVDTLKAQGWTVDFGGQPCWYAPTADSEDASYQVIRLYNPYSHDHYFVPASDTAQIDKLTDLGWRRDSTASAIWSAPANAEGSVQVYTLFNPYNQVDTHLWTANRTEVDTLVGPDAWELNTTTMWGVIPA